MINIIAHRGFWSKPEEKNTKEAFKRALNNGFGIETDLRDFNGEIVISHDIPSKECITFKSFMNIVNEYLPQTLALNIKSDGLQQLVVNDLTTYSDYFCFDMSVPDSLGYCKSEIIFYTRYSDLEKTPSLLDEASGVWLDNFSSNELNVSVLIEFLKKGKHVVLVSPELHGYTYGSYWEKLLAILNGQPQFVSLVGLCTDIPHEAKEFFINVD